MEPIPPEARLLRAALDDPAVLQPDTPEARAAYALRDHVISRIGDALDDVAAPVLLVKGASLACRYPSPWLRPMHDIDLLVQLGDRPGVTDALLAAGFILREQDRNRDSSRTMIGEHVVEWHGGNAMVEVMAMLRQPELEGGRGEEGATVKSRPKCGERKSEPPKHSSSNSKS